MKHDEYLCPMCANTCEVDEYGDGAWKVQLRCSGWSCGFSGSLYLMEGNLEFTADCPSCAENSWFIARDALDFPLMCECALCGHTSQAPTLFGNDFVDNCPFAYSPEFCRSCKLECSLSSLEESVSVREGSMDTYASCPHCTFIGRLKEYEIGTYVCPDCATVSNRGSLVRVSNAPGFTELPSPRNPIYNCLSCDATFGSPGILTPSEGKIVACSSCGKRNKISPYREYPNSPYKENNGLTEEEEVIYGGGAEFYSCSEDAIVELESRVHGCGALALRATDAPRLFYCPRCKLYYSPGSTTEAITRERSTSQPLSRHDLEGLDELLRGDVISETELEDCVSRGFVEEVEF